MLIPLIVVDVDIKNWLLKRQSAMMKAVEISLDKAMERVLPEDMKKIQIQIIASNETIIRPSPIEISRPTG